MPWIWSFTIPHYLFPFRIDSFWDWNPSQSILVVVKTELSILNVVFVLLFWTDCWKPGRKHSPFKGQMPLLSDFRVAFDSTDRPPIWHSSLTGHVPLCCPVQISPYGASRNLQVFSYSTVINSSDPFDKPCRFMIHNRQQANLVAGTFSTARCRQQTSSILNKTDLDAAAAAGGGGSPWTLI